MKSFIVLGFFVLTSAFCLSNKELRERNKIIKERLRTFGKNCVYVEEDLKINKRKISDFLRVASETHDLITEFELFLGIQFYLNEILQDFGENSELEQVSKSQMQQVIKSVDQHLKLLKFSLFSKNSHEKLKEIRTTLSQKQQEIIKLYLENSEITAKLSKTLGMTSETSTKLSNILEKVVYYEKELNSTILNYQSHVENLEKTLQLESTFASIKEKDTFKAIQVSQDQVISRLQQESEFSSLHIQQLSAEILELEGKIQIFDSKSSRLERELSSKSSDLVKFENKFEEFRIKVEENTKFDIERLKNIESYILNRNHLDDIGKLEKELEKNKDELHVCLGQVEINQLNNRKIRNLINDLQDNLEENRLKVQNVQNTKILEVLQIQQGISDCEEETREVQVRIIEEENKIKQQGKTIEQLNYDISEAEYNFKIKSGQDLFHT